MIQLSRYSRGHIHLVFGAERELSEISQMLVSTVFYQLKEHLHQQQKELTLLFVCLQSAMTSPRLYTRNKDLQKSFFMSR